MLTDTRIRTVRIEATLSHFTDPRQIALAMSTKTGHKYSASFLEHVGGHGDCRFIHCGNPLDGFPVYQNAVGQWFIARKDSEWHWGEPDLITTAILLGFYAANPAPTCPTCGVEVFDAKCGVCGQLV